MNQIDFKTVLFNCKLCPRRCGVNRVAGERGFCSAGDEVEIYRFAPHFGEEPPISGSGGSGAIFFSRCTMACQYCQNYPWSQEGAGFGISREKLGAVLARLRDTGCHNWNLISPTQWLPMIVEAIQNARRKGSGLPVVYNTSGYERVETLRALAGTVDVYLADLRYASEQAAADNSSARGYVESARAAMTEMWRQVGELKTSSGGLACSGLICRILVLPGLADEACLNIRWLADNIGTQLSLSIMSQYTPAYRALRKPAWNRKINPSEYSRVCRAAEKFGFTNGWTQDYTVAVDRELAGFNMPAMELGARKA